MNRADHKRNAVAEAFTSALAAGKTGALSVGDVMTTHPVCVHPHQTALELVNIFHEQRFRHLLVTEHDRLVGIISDRDVVRLFGTHDSPEHDYLAKVTAGELMSTSLITVETSTSLLQAVGLIIEHGISCLPVIRGDATIGILTATDLYLALEQLLQRSIAGSNQSLPGAA